MTISGATAPTHPFWSPPGMQPDLPPAFNRFLKNRLMANDLPIDSTCIIASRRALQLSAIFIAAAAQGGMVSVNLDAAKGNNVLGSMLVASNLSSFGSFYAYCSWAILNEAFRTLSPEEQELFKSEIPSWVRLSLKTSAAITGAFSQVPMAYAAYYANNNNLFFAIARFLDAGLPIRSLYLGAKALFKNLNLPDFEQKLEKSKSSFSSLIKQKQSTILSTRPDVAELLRELPGIHGQEAEEYLRRIINLPSEPLQESALLTASKKVSWGIGHLSNFTVMALYGMMTYTAMSLITDDEALKITAALVVVACKFYLWKDSVSRAARDFPSDLSRLVGKQTTPSISQTFMPKFDAVATTASYAIGAFSYGSMKYFCDYYGLGTAATIATSFATALLAKSTFTTLKNGLVESGLARWGNEDQKKVISFYRELGRIATTTDETCRLEWAKFLLSLPDDLKDALYKDGLTSQEIYGYIQTQTGPIPERREMDPVAGGLETPLINGASRPGYHTV